MSERLLYEDHLQQQWNDLPLPDENKAWEDMRRRLEEDEDDRPIIVWWRRGCLLWGLLLLVIFGSGVWLLKEKYFSSTENKKETFTRKDEGSHSKRNDTAIIQTIPSNPGPGLSKKGTEDETGPIKDITGQQNTKPGNNPPVGNETGIEKPVSQTEKEKQVLKKGTGIENPAVTGRRTYRNNTVMVQKDNTVSNPVVTGRRRNRKSTDEIIQKGIAVSNPVVTGRSRNVANPPRKQGDAPSKPSTYKTGEVKTVPTQPVQDIAKDDPLKTDKSPLTNKPDSVAYQPPVKKDSLVSRPPVKKDSLTTNTAKKDSSKKKTPISFSAGIAMQQLLPVAGQKAVPYNSQGRKGTLADYIPSVYFRVIKDRKWFVQGEFKYGAPQFTKEFVFGQRVDTAGQQGNALRTTNTLKKTYYHQLPVTFNYFITKDWSAGAGFTWNKFVKAIVDNEVIRHNITTSRDSLVTKGIVSLKDDSASNFSKSYFQGVIESQYKWKRFSFGARYSFGLQPYIKFTLLNGETGQERSSSLQVFLRYELWRSKKKE